MKTDQAVKISQTFNGRVELQISGSYFKLLTAAASVDVELWLGGRKVLDAPACDAGFYQRVDFDKVVLTNSVNQATTALIAGDQGGSDRFTGSFSISSPLLGDNADNVAAAGASSLVGTVARVMVYANGNWARLYGHSGAGDGQNSSNFGAIAFGYGMGYNGASWDRLRGDNVGGPGAQRVTERGFTYGAAFASVTALAAATNEQVVAPASNTGGLIVWSASMATQTQTATALLMLGLLAKTAAPATAIDGDVLMTLQELTQTAVGQLGAVAQLNRPVFIATGKGLYFRNSGTGGEGTGYRSVLYTLL